MTYHESKTLKNEETKRQKFKRSNIFLLDVPGRKSKWREGNNKRNNKENRSVLKKDTCLLIKRPQGLTE